MGNVNKPRALYTEAQVIAAEAELDALAVNALHMVAFVDTEPEDQLAWAKKARRLSKPAARSFRRPLPAPFQLAAKHPATRQDRPLRDVR